MGSWLSIFGKCLLHIFLLPVKVLASFLFYILYRPAIVFDKNKYLSYTPTDMESKLKSLKENLPIDNYMSDGDGGKFLGLAYASCKDKRMWDALSQLLYKDKTFLRAPWTEDYDRKAFSGDMWAGMFPAILTAIECGHATPEQKKQIAKIIEYTIFKEKTFVFKHPTEKDQDRGFAFPFWSMCSNFFDVITMCYINEKLTKEFKYKFLRYVFTVIGFPTMICLRQGFFISHVYALNFFTEHSALVKAYYVYKLLGYKFLKKPLLRHCKDNPWFADSAKFIFDIDGDFELYNLHLYDYLNTNTIETIPNSWRFEYLSLKGFEKKPNYSKFALPYRFRTGGKYIDDSKPMEPKPYVQKNRNADIIHLYNW